MTQLWALKALGHEASGSFITSLLELKLDVNTIFKWQRHCQVSTLIPHYSDLLEFLNLRAQAFESSLSDSSKKSSKNDSLKENAFTFKFVASFAASADESSTCIL